MGKAEIAERCSLSRRAVDGLLDELIARELVELVELGGGREANTYRLRAAGDELADLRAWRRRAAWERHLAPRLRTRGAKVSACAMRIVYAALLAHRDPNGNAWPALSTLSRVTSLSRRTVVYALDALAARGIVTAQRLAEGDTYPNGRAARPGAVVRRVATIPRPVTPAAVAPDPRAAVAPAVPQPLHPTPAPVAPEVSRERVHVSVPGARATGDALAILQAVAARWNGTLRFSRRDVELAELAAQTFGPERAIRGVTLGVERSRYFGRADAPGLRRPHVLLDAGNLAELVQLAGDVQRVELLRESTIASAPRVELTAEELERRRRDVARMFGRKAAS